MSTTTSPSADDYVSPARAFDRVVWKNARVCNGCFEHVKEIQEATFSGGVSEHSAEDHHRTPQATLEPDERIVETVDGSTGGAHRGDAGADTERPGPKRSAIARTTCRSCARVGCWAESDTLTQIQATRLVNPLLERLEEAGLDVDEETLRYLVWNLKAKEDIQGKDTEIFRVATKKAIQRA